MTFVPELALKNGLGHIDIPLPLFLLLFLFSAFLPVFAVKVQEIDLDFFYDKGIYALEAVQKELKPRIERICLIL
jgi:hypothetical protein